MPYFGVPIRNGISPGLGSVIGFGSRNPIQAVITALFGAGEQGIAVPDLSPNNGFLFQDSTGATTPVTAFEQKVGYILDRSGRGNHIRTTNSTSAPTLSARYNRLTYTEQFNNAAWTKRGTATITPDDAIAPNGTLTADKISGLNTGANDIYNANLYTIGFPANAAITPSIYVKRISTSGTFSVEHPFGPSYGYWSVNLALLPDAWVQLTATTTGVTVTKSFTATAAGEAGILMAAISGGPLSMHIWGADLRLTIDTIAQPAYQRVGASTDYDTNGFYPYLSFGGTQSMYTAATVDFSATAQMTVFHGVTKLSDAAAGVVSEFSTTSSGNNGAFAVFAPGSVAPDYYIRSRGTASSDAQYNNALAAAPNMAVLTADMQIATDVCVLRRNGAQVATSATDQGTGNYGNYVLYLAARNNASIYVTGRLYPFFICGASKSAGVISQVESFIKGRMPVTW